ncbi:MAG: ABC transporter ATP-binding protein, partial [Anaerolineae bacterium]|nr:ABC transporter ATP-binding protein [Anaerolineae bacterium]
SGGQRQRITVARTLLLRPRLVIADEPVSMVDASLRATILENLRTLHQEFGISFLYITHDLTTAYQMCQNIIILYRGSVAEIGSVDHVIKAPQHPYSQELIGAVPSPNPRRRWEVAQARPEAEDLPDTPHTGCKYANRCAYAMPICRQSAPPLYQTNPQRAVACYLYQESPVIASEETTRLFSAQQPVAAPAGDARAS